MLEDEIESATEKYSYHFNDYHEVVQRVADNWLSGFLTLKVNREKNQLLFM